MAQITQIQFEQDIGQQQYTDQQSDGKNDREFAEDFMKNSIQKCVDIIAKIGPITPDVSKSVTDPIFDKINESLKHNMLNRCNSTSSLLSSTNGEEETEQISDFYTSIPFGIQPLASYDHGKKNTDIMAVAYNGRMRQFILLDAKGITTWKRDAVEHRVAKAYSFPKYEYRMFTHIIYVKKFNCYFVLTKDFSLKVFNRDFEETCSVNADLRSILFMLFNPRKDELITGGVGGTKFWTFHQVSENAYENLKPMANYRLTLRCELPDVGGSWVKRVELDCYLEHLYCCSDTDLNVYNLQGNLLLRFKKAHKMTLTGCRYSMSAKVLVTSSIDCYIKVWSMTGGLVHTFYGHSRAVTNLMIHPENSSIIISSSLDGSVRLWSLETLEPQYSLIVSSSGILWMGLTDDDKLYICTCEHLTLWSLNYFYDYWSTARSKLYSMSLAGCSYKTTRIVTIGDDNSVRLFARKSQRNLTTILPPPDLSPLENISSMCYSRQFNVSFLLINREDDTANEVWVYTTRTDPSCRIAVWNVQDLQMPYLARCQKTENTDGFIISNSYNSTAGGPIYRATTNGSGNESLTICHCLCLLNSMALMLNDEGLACSIRQCYLLMGMEDGRIFFMDPVVKGQKYMEFKASKDAILKMSHDSEHNSLITLSKLKYLTQIQIWMLPSLYLQHEVYCNLDIVDYTRIDNLFLTAHESGCLNKHILQPMVDNGFYKQRTVPEFGDVVDIFNRPAHMEPIICLDSCPSMKLFCSCSAEGAIKIWDEQRCLLTEIMMDETLSSALFLNNKADLIVGFKNHIYCIDHSRVCPHLKPREDVEDEFDTESVIYEDPAVTYEGIGAYPNPDPIDINTYLIPYEIEFCKDFLEGKLPWESSSEEELKVSDFESEYSMAPTEIYFSPPETPVILENIDLLVGTNDLKQQMLYTMQHLYDEGFTHNQKCKQKNESDGKIDVEDELSRWSFNFPKYGLSPGPSPTLSFISRNLSLDSDGSDVCYEEVIGRNGKTRKKKKSRKHFQSDVSSEAGKIDKHKARYRGDYAEGESSGIGDVRLDVKTLLKKAAILEAQKNKADLSHVRAEIDEHVSNVVRKQRDFQKKKVAKQRKAKQGQKILSKLEKPMIEEKLIVKQLVPRPPDMLETIKDEIMPHFESATFVTNIDDIQQIDMPVENLPNVILVPDLPQMNYIPEKVPVVKTMVPIPKKNMIEYFYIQKPGIGQSPTAELDQQEIETTVVGKEEAVGIKNSSATIIDSRSNDDEPDDIATCIMKVSPEHYEDDDIEEFEADRKIGAQIKSKFYDSGDSGWASRKLTLYMDKGGEEEKHKMKTNIDNGDKDVKFKKRPLSSFAEKRIYKVKLRNKHRPLSATEIRHVCEKEDLHIAFNEAYHRYQHLSCVPVTPNSIHKSNDLIFDDNWHERFIERHMLLRMQKELRAHEAVLSRKQKEDKQKNKLKYILGLYSDEDYQDPGKYQYYTPAPQGQHHAIISKHVGKTPYHTTPQITPTNSQPHTTLPKYRHQNVASQKGHSPVKLDKKRPTSAVTFIHKDDSSIHQQMFKYGRYSQLGMCSDRKIIQNETQFSLLEKQIDKVLLYKGGDTGIKARAQASYPSKLRKKCEKSRPKTSHRLEVETEKILQSLSKYNLGDCDVIDSIDHDNRINTPYRFNFEKEAPILQNISKHQVEFDVKQFDPRNPRGIPPKSRKSIPSKCSQYVLLSKPKEKLLYPLPTPLEEQLLAKRFPELGHRIYDHFDGLIVRHKKPEYNIEYSPFARELY